MPLTEQERTALTRFRDEVRAALPDQAPDIVLFGSKARGDDNPESDVDVLVRVESDDWRLSDTVYGIAARLTVETGVCISPKVVSRLRFDRMRNEGRGFATNVLRDAVTV